MPILTLQRQRHVLKDLPQEDNEAFNRTMTPATSPTPSQDSLNSHGAITMPNAQLNRKVHGVFADLTQKDLVELVSFKKIVITATGISPSKSIMLTEDIYEERRFPNTEGPWEAPGDRTWT